ncbi:MAG: hypothetical protein ACRCTP_25180 [Aeromonas popoffii]|uniref:hypothetical protein n=1 Tax=Aeromonas popoffii TaxID=70856 RepID=UPI003F417255
MRDNNNYYFNPSAINRHRKQQAKRDGAIYYLPVDPCHYGHQSPRYVSDGHCVECRRNWHKTGSSSESE